MAIGFQDQLSLSYLRIVNFQKVRINTPFQ